jgi:hypothetical protein
LYPAGAHASEALKNITEALSDELITFANDKGGDKYAIEMRGELKKLLSSLVVKQVFATKGTKGTR